MAKRSEVPNLRLAPSGRITCRNDNTVFIRTSQLELFIEAIYDRIAASITPQFVRIIFSASLSICSFCLSPLLTCSPEDLKAPFSMKPETIHTCLVMLTILSALFSFCTGIYIFIKYLKHHNNCTRDAIRRWGIDYASETFSDKPEVITPDKIFSFNPTENE